MVAIIRRRVDMFYTLRRRLPLVRVSTTRAGWWFVYILASIVVALTP